MHPNHYDQMFILHGVRMDKRLIIKGLIIIWNVFESELTEREADIRIKEFSK